MNCCLQLMNVSGNVFFLGEMSAAILQEAVFFLFCNIL